MMPEPPLISDALNGRPTQVPQGDSPWRPVSGVPRVPVSARSPAYLALIGLAMLFWAVAAIPPVAKPSAPRFNQADTVLFGTIVERVKSGESYYAAASDEQSRRLYPTASVVNWRTPALVLVLAHAPSLSAGLYWLLAFAIVVATIYTLRECPVGVAAAATAAQVFCTLLRALSPHGIFIFEVWAGMLIALSICSFAAHRHLAGGLLALIALFVRELALPYVAAVVALRWRPAGRTERGVYLAGISGYAAYYAAHVFQVAAHAPGESIAHESSYLALGGLSFIVAALAGPVFQFLAPPVVIAAALVLIAAGLSSREAPLFLRVGAGLFLGLFLLIGQPFNWYWGWLISPLIPIISAYGVLTIARLIMTATGYCPSGKRLAAL